MTTTTNPNKPITIRDGSLKLSIFKNQTEKGFRFSVNLVRSYTDQQGQWHDTNSLSNAELLRAANLLIRGYNRIQEFKSDLNSHDEVESGE